MERPFAVVAVVVGVIAALCVFLPWHTIELASPVVFSAGATPSAEVTHDGLSCGLHGTWFLVFSALAAGCSALVALGLGPRLPVSTCRVLLFAALLFGASAVFAAYDLFRDASHCFGDLAASVAEDERENGFYIALLASIFGAMSAGLACLVRRTGPDSGE
jgi:hypothetical protein